MRIRDVKSTVLQVLYRHYEEHGFEHGTDLDTLEQQLPDAKPGAAEQVLRGFHDRGLVDYEPLLHGLSSIRLTDDGVEEIENPEGELAPYVQTIHVAGGNVQIGNANTQNITYQTVLQNLKSEIERQNIPEEEKRRLLAAAGELLRHPFTQTAVNFAATVGAAIAGR